MRRAFGILLVIAGALAAALGCLRAPSASACAAANKISLDLGQSATCSTSPSPLCLAVAAALVVAGALLALPWRRRPGAR
jgi:hypothetical protein